MSCTHHPLTTALADFCIPAFVFSGFLLSPLLYSCTTIYPVVLLIADLRSQRYHDLLHAVVRGDDRWHPRLANTGGHYLGLFLARADPRVLQRGELGFLFPVQASLPPFTLCHRPLSLHPPVSPSRLLGCLCPVQCEHFPIQLACNEVRIHNAEPASNRYARGHGERAVREDCIYQPRSTLADMRMVPSVCM